MTHKDAELCNRRLIQANNNQKSLRQSSQTGNISEWWWYDLEDLRRFEWSINMNICIWTHAFQLSFSLGFAYEGSKDDIWVYSSNFTFDTNLSQSKYHGSTFKF